MGFLLDPSNSVIKCCGVFLFCTTTYVVGTQWNCLDETIPVSTDKYFFLVQNWQKVLWRLKTYLSVLTGIASMGNSNEHPKLYFDVTPKNYLISTPFILSFFFFFLFGFYSPFKNISLILSQSFIKGGWKPENLGKKNTWPSVSRTWLFHMRPEWGSNHSGEKPNGLRVSSLIHQAKGACKNYLELWTKLIINKWVSSADSERLEQPS